MRRALIAALLVGVGVARASGAAEPRADCVQEAEAARGAAADPSYAATLYQLVLAECQTRGAVPARGLASHPLPARAARVVLPAPPCDAGQRCLPEPSYELSVLSGERWRYGAAVLQPGEPETARTCEEMAELLADAPPADLRFAIGAASEEGSADCEAWRACVRGQMLASVVVDVGAATSEAMYVWNLQRHRRSREAPSCAESPTNDKGVCTAYERPRVVVSVRDRGAATEADVLEEFWRRCEAPDAPAGCLKRVDYPDAAYGLIALDQGCGPEPASCKKPRQPALSGADLCPGR